MASQKPKKTRKAVKPAVAGSEVEWLKSLEMFEHTPDDKLKDLAKFLERCEFKGGEIIFDEGSKGDSLFFIASGSVRILKKGSDIDGGESFKELAILGAGDCFGEMTLFEELPRSARAAAEGDAVLIRLGRKELQNWLKSNPSLAIGFFTELTHVLSTRLRRSSAELSLLFDLSRWLLEPIATGKNLLQKILQHLIPHFEGNWSASAHLFNEFNNEMEAVASSGTLKGKAAGIQAPSAGGANTWLDDSTYQVLLPGKKHLQGFLVFQSAEELSMEDRNEIGRTLTTVARLISSALENISFRTEDSLRQRLSTSRHAAGF